MKVYIDEKVGISIETLREYDENINKANSKENADVLILSKITEIKDNIDKYFMFIWKSYDLNQMQDFNEKYNYRYLLGFFLKKDVENYSRKVLDAFDYASKKLKKAKKLKNMSKKVNKIPFSHIINPKSFDKQRNKKFESLFLDRPMFKVMMGLNAMLTPIIENLKKINENYKKTINEIQNEKIFNEKFFENILSKNYEDFEIEPIILTGETGVGKTLIVRWIYERLKKESSSTLAYKELNASLFSENLFESEMFGYMEGAFTDAEGNKPGKALLAFGGILFIDEIGDIPIKVQPQIIKFIEEFTFEPQGWKFQSPLYSPLLIIGATNRNLNKEVETGNFRKDLLARFRNRLHIPSLNERKDSIDLLATFCILKEINKTGYTNIKYIEEKAFSVFESIDYTMDNFRLLERIAKRVVYKAKKYNLDIILADLVKEIKEKEGV